MRDHEGLQVAEENVSGRYAADISSKPGQHTNLERTWSADQPEVVSEYRYAPVPVSSEEQLDYQWTNGRAGGLRKREDNDPVSSPSPRKSRRRLICTIAIIVLVLVVGAVAGGVLGAKLPGKSHGSSTTSVSPGASASPPNSTSPTELLVREDTGIAAFTSDGMPGDMLLFYQDSESQIQERVMQNGTLTSQPNTSNPVGSGVAPSSPLAAMEYSLLSESWYLLFYISTSSQLMMINRTSTTSWSQPILVLDTDTIVAKDIALETMYVSNYDQTSAVRLYYGSGNGQIGEIGIGGSPYGASWTGRAGPLPPLNASDAYSGIVGTSYNDAMYLYVRNNQSGASEQWQSVAGVSAWHLGESEIELLAVHLNPSSSQPQAPAMRICLSLQDLT
ncbi:hypothetical protein LTR78_005093 [Recurvomyces mirabilis]|uniref:Fucose-specific lectin n=1 Tax=Recurvomyces mirabilis TaxID=574656 RepID=A0AAE0WNW4_9PEZI|nr:hypothetical protein LTR78_005093 [Recurvomyces mirabilis]KAK5158290.1 hypothetical protein LTS14_003308 [Recurvomyces mirabilis]